MGLETGTYIDDLVATNPVATDGLAQADDHLRLIKSTIKATFPSITGAVDATHTEINTVADGGTAATATTLADADRLVVNDDGTMVQVALTDLKTYLTSNLSITSAMITDGTIQSGDIGDGEVTAAKLASDVSLLPAGLVAPYAGSTAPTGYLLCYGQNVSRTTYAALFTAIGTTYGSGDGSTTFTLPDLRGRVVAGQDDMGGTSANRLTSPIDGDTLGAAGGAESVTLSENEMPSHKHTTTTPHVHIYGANGVGKWSVENTVQGGSISVDSDYTGGGAAHNNLQPTIVLNYIIKT